VRGALLGGLQLPHRLQKVFHSFGGALMMPLRMIVNQKAQSAHEVSQRRQSCSSFRIKQRCVADRNEALFLTNRFTACLFCTHEIPRLTERIDFGY
jgi:hypothetical protein